MPDVLVVADNADLRYLLEIALTLEGQAVETAVTRSDTTHGSGRRAGYEGSAPVRIGNAAAPQRQLDVYGEVMDALHQARRIGIPPDEEAWAVQRALLEWLEGGWREPDNGLWEVRGPARILFESSPSFGRRSSAAKQACRRRA